MVNGCRSRSVTGPPPVSAPVRILGPCRSCKIAMGRPSRAATARTRRIVSACSSSVPCEKLMRATSMPAPASASMLSVLAEAGPSVQTILVRRGVIEPPADSQAGQEALPRGSDLIAQLLKGAAVVDDFGGDRALGLDGRLSRQPALSLCLGEAARLDQPAQLNLGRARDEPEAMAERAIARLDELDGVEHADAVGLEGTHALDQRRLHGGVHQRLQLPQPRGTAEDQRAEHPAIPATFGVEEGRA